jgi:hypothetical protein
MDSGASGKYPARRAADHCQPTNREMYVPDLTPYADYDRPTHRIFHVGWLIKSEPFETEPPSEEVVAQLKRQLPFRVLRTRGWFKCHLCKRRDYLQLEEDKQELGGAEIWIENGDVTYACPDMIIHYIEDHHYKPPAAFLKALKIVDSKGRRPKVPKKNEE